MSSSVLKTAIVRGAALHGWVPQPDEPCRGSTGIIFTIPNLVTLLRMIAATAALSLALVAPDSETRAHFLNAGVAITIFGDLADGLTARIFRQESRFGAVFDGCADRLAITMIFCTAVLMYPDRALLFVFVMVCSLAVDFPLSLSFIPRGLTSHTEFDRVSVSLWWWNYSPPAKLVHSILIPLATVFIPVWIAAVFVAASALLKLCSLIRLSAL